MPYKLSDAEAQLYKEVTDYVREEFNRAEALQNDKRAGTVGFALTILQRRLASSPEAIYQSLRRRRERLESRLRELELLQRGGQVAPILRRRAPALDAEDVEDLEEAPDDEVEAAEEEILDQATAAAHDRRAEGRDRDARRGSRRWRSTCAAAAQDTKWRELAQPARRDLHARRPSPTASAKPSVPYGAGPIPKPVPSPRQKLVIFTEHRDTLNYLDEPHRDAARPAARRWSSSTAAWAARSGARRRRPSRTTRRCRCCSPPTRPARASTSSAPT